VIPGKLSLSSPGHEISQASVYVETSVVSYLSARPSRNLVVAAHQQITQDWWKNYRQYEFVVSELVIAEVSRGDSAISARRLAILKDVKRLVVSEQTRFIVERLVTAKLVPGNAIADAIHIAAAATSGIECLLTWNCAHIANAVTRPRIEEWFRSQGIMPSIICTPEELIGS